MRHFRSKSSFNGSVGIIMCLWALLMVAVLYGWGSNLYNIVKKYPPLKEWQASNVVCAIGIPAAPVGIVCGWIDGGVPEKEIR